MKANELRLGNLVLGAFEQPTKVSYTILTNFAVGMESIKPIPLTEEWLIKFGKEQNNNGIYPEYDLIIDDKTILRVNFYRNRLIILNTDGTDFIELDFPEHVHQLQNLYFALCGEELTIKE